MSQLHVELAGFAIRLDGLQETERDVVRRRWPGLVREAPQNGPSTTINVERVERVKASGEVVDPHRPLELKLAYHRGYTDVESTDLEGRLSWKNDALAGTLRTTSSGSEAFRGALENFLRVVVAHALVLKGGFLAHAAVVFDREEALLFVGPSGAGKSTVSKLALERGGRIASDDLNPVMLSPEAGRQAFAGGSPFYGEIGDLDSAPRRLRGIYRLEKSTRDDVRSIGVAETVGTVFACSPFVNRSPFLRERLLSNIERVASLVSGYALSFRREGSFWPLVGMS